MVFGLYILYQLFKWSNVLTTQSMPTRLNNRYLGTRSYLSHDVTSGAPHLRSQCINTAQLPSALIESLCDVVHIDHHCKIIEACSRLMCCGCGLLDAMNLLLHVDSIHSYFFRYYFRKKFCFYDEKLNHNGFNQRVCRKVFPDKMFTWLIDELIDSYSFLLNEVV